MVWFFKEYTSKEVEYITEIVKPILIISISTQGKGEQKPTLYRRHCTKKKKKMSPTALKERMGKSLEPQT